MIPVVSIVVTTNASYEVEPTSIKYILLAYGSNGNTYWFKFYSIVIMEHTHEENVSNNSIFIAYKSYCVKWAIISGYFCASFTISVYALLLYFPV